MYKLPPVGSIVSFKTQHQDWVVGRGSVLEHNYEKVVVVPPVWVEPGIFFIASKEERDPIKCITIRNVFDLKVNGKQGAQANSEDVVTHKIVLGSKGDKYTVTLRNGKPYHCTCIGFGFHRKCSHLKLV